MSIFGKIKDAIFGKAQAAEPAVSNANAAPSAGPAPAPAPTAAPSVAKTASAGAAPASPTPPAAAAPASTSAPVDVAAIMDKAVKDSGQTLHWRTSIVDTMKALHLDSSLSERQALAQELGYTGDTKDSATMNVWLQKALMQALSKNGGKVPAELTD